VFAIVGVLAMVSLGTWQMQRLAWKNGLIAQIEARTRDAPIPLSEALRRAAAGEDIEYLRVRAEGRLMSGRERYYYAPSSSAGPGWHVYAPLATSSGIVIVNRGFVADRFRDPATRPEAADRDVVIVGLARRPEARTMFTPDNDEARNVWYWRDLAGMTRSMLPSPSAPVAPFFLEAEAGKADGPGPRGGATRLEIPNNHFQYAMTWYGLALTLIGVYAALALGRHKGPE
jgi:surfeit locus 1 family protein